MPDAEIKIEPHPGSARRWAETMVSFHQACGYQQRGGVLTPMEFLLLHGQQFAPGGKVRRRATPKQCFMNAYKLADRKGLVYVEGLATHIIPTEHAWCLDPASGRIIDPTWSDTGLDYFGVPIPMEVLHRIMLRTEVFGVLSCWWVWEEVHAILAAHFGGGPSGNALQDYDCHDSQALQIAERLGFIQLTR